MNYYRFQVEEVRCDACGWTGTGAQAERGETFAALFECHCPRCKKKLGICTYPTEQEAREAWDLVPEADRIQFELRRMLADAQARHALQRADELPAIDLPEFSLLWDVEDVKDGWPKSWTVIRLGDRVLWREPAFYEDAERFAEVAALLKERYGDALIDLAPTPAGIGVLYGDRWASDRIVEEARSRVRAGRVQ